MKHQFHTTVRKGKLTVAATKGIIQALQSMEGKYITISIENEGNKRSNAQNRYWWGVVVAMCMQRFKGLGNEVTAEEVHEFLKMQSEVSKMPVGDISSGEAIGYMLKSTTKLTTVQFMELIADVQRWAAEKLDIVIPDPIESFE